MLASPLLAVTRHLTSASYTTIICGLMVNTAEEQIAGLAPETSATYYVDKGGGENTFVLLVVCDRDMVDVQL